MRCHYNHNAEVKIHISPGITVDYGTPHDLIVEIFASMFGTVF